MLQLQQVWAYGERILEQEEREKTRKCFKCDKEEHIMKDCKGKQLMKKQKIQEESDDKKQSFGENLK